MCPPLTDHQARDECAARIIPVNEFPAISTKRTGSLKALQAHLKRKYSDQTD